MLAHHAAIRYAIRGTLQGARALLAAIAEEDSSGLTVTQYARIWGEHATRQVASEAAATATANGGTR